ncbi:Diacylglycerol kinase, partial [Fasciolopsis buskii]
TPPRQTHHWREGNLPPNSKCATCRKTCWSSECLTGYRCQWCGLTAHAACLSQLGEECDFGPLRDIMLPACCVSLPRPNVPIEHIIGITKRPRSRAISEDWSSSGDSKEDSWQDRRSPKETIDRASSDEYVCVFDGIGGLKRRSGRSFSFSKTMSTYSAVKRCLKTFHLAGTPDFYNVYEVNDRDGRENKLNANANFRSQLRFDVKQPSIVLRAKEPEQKAFSVKIYAGDLGYLLPPNASDYETVLITSSTTSADAVAAALDKFGCGHLGPEDCYLSTVCTDRVVTERRMSSHELLVALLSQLRHESSRTAQLTRFELRFTEDSPGSHTVSVFVGNLKENLSQRLYECILLEKLGESCRWDTIDAIYYESGCLVLTYRSGERAERAYELLKDSMLMDKPLTALLLPRIHPRMLPQDLQPLLVFVNLKSGGCQGMDLIVSFRRLLNPFQVFNLDYGGPLPGLYCFRQLSSYKILVCGGDGTVGWVLSCLDIVGQDAACNSPAIAPLPLGTGNDLARVLRWGSGYSSADDPLTILKDVVTAEEVQLDRWTFVVRPDEEFKDETKLALELQTNASNTNEDNSIMIIMNNYFGIGIDADLSLDFHNARSENPSKFNSRIHNKGVYFKIGLRKMINRTACKDLHKQIVVVADGNIVMLPPIEGLIVLNILSWGGGANPWGMEKDDVFAKPTHYDGLLEVVGISGVVHMGQIYSGLGTGIRLAQAGHLKILLKTELPIQIDGEPFIHPAGQIVVLRSALRATMLRKVKRIKRRTMEITVPSELSRLVIQQSTQPDSLETISAEKASPLIMSTGDLASTSAIGVTNLVLTDYAKSTEENLCVRAHPPVTQSRSYDLATSSTPHIRTHKSGRGSMLSHTESSPPSFVSDATRLEPNSRAMDGGPLDQITHPPSLLPPCLLTGDDGVETPIIHALTTGSKPSSSFSS